MTGRFHLTYLAEAKELLWLTSGDFAHSTLGATGLRCEVPRDWTAEE